MDALLLCCLLPSPPMMRGEQRQEQDQLPTMYALSKNGNIREYQILVEDFGDYAILTTRKRTTLNGKWQEDSYRYDCGVNIGKTNETTYLEQAKAEALSMWKSLKDKGFTSSIPTGKFNTDANGKMKPMLAIKFDATKIQFPCIVQPKYDGVRCLIFKDAEGVHIISRKGKPYNIPHIQKWAEKNTHLLPLDGELYNHKELTFQEIISAVKRVSDITPKIRYVVYDRPVVNEPNYIRWADLIQHFTYEVSADAPVYLSEGVLCDTMEQINEYHTKCVAEGYEGVIIRNREGLYEFGFRSNNLIKLKTFDDAEFEIVDVLEASGRDEGTAIFQLKCEGGIFNAKPQGTRELRHDYFVNRAKLIGKMATVKYQGTSDDGIPRFPSAISVRDYE